MKHTVLKGTIIFIVILLLASCMGVESKITIRNNGSGKIMFSYRISKMLLSMNDSAGTEGTDLTGDDSGDEAFGESGEETGENSTVPLPVTKEDFEKNVKDVPGLKLIDVTQSETENDVLITANLEFDNVDALSKSEAFSSWPITFTKKNNSYVFSQLISEGTADSEEAESDEETIKMIESMFQGYELVFSIEAPSTVKEYNIGTLSADKKTVVYRIPIADMMRVKNKLELVITW